MKKRASAVLTAASMIVSALVSCGTAYAAELDTNPNGATAQSLPTKIDLRDHNGKNYVTPVKNQDPYGTCWAFGIAAAAETSYLYANGLGVPAGEKNTNVNFSEKYIAWFLYHGITENDVTKGKIRASQIGEGNDMEQADKEYSAAAYNFGGTGSNGLNFLASGFGPVDESVSVDDWFPYYYAGKNRFRNGTTYSPNDNWTIPVNSKYRNPLSVQGFKGGKLLRSPSSWDENGQYRFDEDALNAMKTELSNGHAISLGVCFGANMHPDNWALFNNGDNYYSNHEVTIVGYDDNYSKDNFTRYFKSGKIAKGTTPPGDGAFIVKNTNGSLTEEDKATATVNEMGKTVYEDPNAGKFGVDDSGYFYLSYHDHSMETPICFDFESEASVKYKEHNYDQYDLMAASFYNSSDYESVSKMANVFDAEEDEYLYSISYRTNAPGSTAAYEIYKNVENGDPASGTLLETGETTHDQIGYYNIGLKGEYLMKKGEKYSVVITMCRPSSDGENKVYSDVVPFATNMLVDGTHKAIINGVVNPGESYFCTGGEWKDMTDIREDIIDAVYQQTGEYTREKKDFIEMNPDGRDGIKIDNYPIKALLVPADKHGSETLVGDVNGDSKLTIDDATEIQKYLAQKADFTDAQKAAADANGDGEVTINDATHLQKYLAQYNVTLGNQPTV